MVRAKHDVGSALEAPSGQDARRMIKARLAEMYSWEYYINEPYSISELHNLRIAIKRLRYSLEIFIDTLSEEITVWIQEIEKIQEELGVLHDSDVMIALLRLCLGSLDAGIAYTHALRHIADQQEHSSHNIINPVLLKQLLNREVAPTEPQRRGLELMLSSRQLLRQEQLKNLELEQKLVESLDR